MNISLMNAATENSPEALAAMPPWLMVLAIAAGVKLANKKWLEDGSLIANIVAGVCAAIGFFGLLVSLFGI